MCVANPPDDLTKSGCPVYDPGCDCDEEDEVSTCPGDTRSEIFFAQFQIFLRQRTAPGA